MSAFDPLRTSRARDKLLAHGTNGRVMSGADYILGLLAIITGLAISDMIVSLHGLLINRRNVRWDWLPLVAASCVLLLIISTWRHLYAGLQGAVKGPPIWVFVIILMQNVGLYLAARAALPDRANLGEPCDLRAHYDFVDRYLWSALTLSYGAFIFLAALEPLLLGKLQFPSTFYHSLLAFPVLLALVIWPHRKLHRLIVPLLFLWVCVRVLPARLLVA